MRSETGFKTEAGTRSDAECVDDLTLSAGARTVLKLPTTKFRNAAFRAFFRFIGVHGPHEICTISF